MTTTVFYATNRKPIGTAAAPDYFSLDAEAGNETALYTGQAEVTTEAAPEAARHILSVTPDRPGSGVPPAIRAWAQAAAASQQDALLFIHGYANSWVDSITRAAQLRDFYAQSLDNTSKPLAMLAFGWPSDGQFFPPSTHYPADRQDAQQAGRAMAATLGHIAKVRPKRLHLIAHSMGNWALRNGLAAFVPPGGEPLFDEVVLAAADEDLDALTRQDALGTLGRLGKRITVLVYDWDWVLGISHRINGIARLGAEWPVALPAATGGRDDAAVRVGMVLNDTEAPQLTVHQYYRNNREVRRDLIAVLESRPQARIRGRTTEDGDARQFTLRGATGNAVPMV